MFIIEYVASPTREIGEPALFDELALGSTVEEAKDQADTHLPAMKSKYGALGYWIFDKNRHCVAVGPGVAQS